MEKMLRHSPASVANFCGFNLIVALRRLTMYWEKTVEYFFLCHCIQSKLVDFASPLSGKHERGAGDAIFGNCSNLLLIEFKADDKSLDTEEEKFDDYKTAKKLLANSDLHHFFVYGTKDDRGFKVAATRYFSRHAVHLDNCLPTGLPKDPFDKYLLQFLALRKRDGRSGGKAIISDFANVIGLNSNGCIVQACTLAEYSAQVFPTLVKDLTHETDATPSVTPKRKP
ncbi:hypothetical protein [Acidovorax sacchari]|uniref:hypothetical protein n=1 Tax=Acidovorax sacchari TaxID=3230736 RepID=UPI0039E3E590